MIYLDLKKLPKKIIILSIIFFLIFFFIIGVRIAISIQEQRLTCALFATQFEAQQAYNSDPKRYAKLDGYDHDGVVCENLPKRAHVAR